MSHTHSNYVLLNGELRHWGVKGMKWGVRRYRNTDGTLTPAGQKRYERDQRENSGKKKGNKVGEANPDKWVREDMERSKRLADAGSNLNRELVRINDKQIKNTPKTKMDLSNMTDKELRDQINRAFLEKQYNEMFAPQQVSKGREYATKILDRTGDILALTSTSLAIALAIKELRG